MQGNCWVCGNKIEDPNQNRVYLRKYRTCGAKCHHKLIFERLPLNGIEKRSQIKCEVCGKPATFAINISRQYYCSEECRHIALAPIKAFHEMADAWLRERYKRAELAAKDNRKLIPELRKTRIQQLSLF